MPYFRLDDARWGLGYGGDLPASIIDENTWEFHSRILNLEQNPPQANGIANVQVAGTQMTITLNDGQAFTHTLPVSTMRSRGNWTANTVYSELDIVTHPNTGVYLVLLDHTSGTTFDPAAADANGNAYYHKMFDAPLGDAPLDGLMYGRQNGAWTAIDVVVDWTDIQGKPATFPPEQHSHQWTEVGGKPDTIQNMPALFGAAGQALRVSSTGLWEWFDPGTGGGSSTFLALTDTPAAFGAPGHVAVVNAAGDGLVFGAKLVIPAAAADGAFFSLTPTTAPPTAPANGDMWTTGAQLAVQLNGISRTVAFINMGQSWTEKQTFRTSIAGTASVRIPHGSDPTAPVDGDIWTTIDGLKARINGATITFGSGGGGGGGGAGTQTLSRIFKGVLLRLQASFATSTTNAAVSWGTGAAELDTNGFYSDAAPTVITIPAGVTRVRLKAGVDTAALNSYCQIFITQNNEAFPGKAYAGFNHGAGGSQGGYVETREIPVTAGDTFRLMVNTGAASSLDPTLATFFALEVIEGSVLDQTVDTGISDAPADGTPYARQDGGWVPASSGGGGAFRGAAAQIIFTPATLNAFVPITLGTERYDTDNIYTPGGDLVVPAGVTKVRLKAMMRRASGSTNNQFELQKNGAGVAPEDGGFVGATTSGYANNGSNMESDVLTVTGGDAFRLAGYFGGTQEMRGWFAMEIIA